MSVALLEAGGRNASLLVRMPAGASRLFNNKNPSNWAFKTEPQSELEGRRLFQPRGRGWGGSSSINAMIYIRGHARDYDQWRQMGLTGWGYADVLPYFKRAQNNEIGGDDWNGEGGPLHVSPARPAIRCRKRSCRRRTGGLSGDTGLQRAPTGRRRHLSAHHSGRPTLQRGGWRICDRSWVCGRTRGDSPTRTQRASSSRTDARSASNTRRPPTSRCRASLRQPRSDLERGRVPVAASPAALRHRPGGGAEEAGRRRRRRCAGSRRAICRITSMSACSTPAPGRSRSIRC